MLIQSPIFTLIIQKTKFQLTMTKAPQGTFKPKAIIAPFTHRGATHIRIDTDHSPSCKQLIKQIAGYKWTQTYRCWYIPNTKEAYQQLEERFIVLKKEEGEEINTSETKPLPLLKSMKPVNSLSNKGEMVRVEKEHETRVKVFVPWQRRDWIDKIKTIHGRAWNEEEKYWSLPMVKTTFWRMKEWFGKALKIGFKLSANISETYVPNKWINESESHYYAKKPMNKESKDWEIIVPEQVIFQEIMTKEGMKKMVVGKRLIVRPHSNGIELVAFCPFD